MNVLFTLLSPWTHHFGTELELIHRHLKRGDHVSVLTCLDDVPSCVKNPSHTRWGCRRCISQRLDSLRLLDDAIHLESFANYLEASDFAAEKALDVPFTSLQAAQDLSIDEWDVGYAALSTTIHLLRDPYLSTDNARRTWQILLRTGFRAHRAMLRYLEAHPETELVVVFNGRFAMARGILRACEKKGVDITMHERGSNNSKYALFENHLPHDRGPFLQKLEQAWQDADPKTREEIGSSFYERRRVGIADAWHSFIDAQDQGKLPQSWDKDANNIVIFNSSEDEFIAIGKEWQNPIYPSQSEGVAQIVASCKDDDATLYLRMHPNLKGVDNQDTQRLFALDGKGIELIPPESPVSTYDLLEAADKVLSFGSTVGIEAVYWGRPSILAGLCFYRDLEGTYNAQSHEDVLHLLRSDLSPKDRLTALKYGYYLHTYGIPFQYYNAESFGDGRFRGEVIEPGWTPYGELLTIGAHWLGEHPHARGAASRFLRPLLHEPFEPLRDWLAKTRHKL